MKRYTFSLLLSLLVLSYTPHPTAFHYYASFKGAKQGQFKGESTKGREKDGWFEITGFQMGVENPADSRSSGSGGSTGKAKNKPIVITKEVDAASPLLLNAHYNNETFETIVIQTLDDQNKVTRTTTLKNALISEIKKNGSLESISFNYADIQSQQ
jgi:type VI secretion system Hcp family effector